MPRRPLRVSPSPAGELAAGFAAIRAEAGLPEAFPPAVQAEAEARARKGPGPFLASRDATDIPFVTLDPVGSRDLDQAFWIGRRAGGGFDVAYAIADVASFVTAGSALDVETAGRGLTVYAPDGKIPLHPTVLSEGAASLLPDGDRPAALWELELAADGEVESVRVSRATVRSRAQLDYPAAQAAIDGGTATEPLSLLPEVGRLREERERARGGVSLPLPEQIVVGTEDGGWRLEYRADLPVEGWNAQLSLMTGMAAAGLMLEGGIGLLRIVPRAPDEAREKLRAAAAALGAPWEEAVAYGDWIRSLDPAVPAHAALLQQAAGLSRGAAYAAFEGERPEVFEHAALASPYAHVTAPLRRLCDRATTEVCLALCAGEEVPEWARAALPLLPDQMAAADRRAGKVERAAIDLMEACVLAPQIGETFAAVVLDEHLVQLREPPVRAKLSGPAEVGAEISARLVEASVAERKVRFEAA